MVSCGFVPDQEQKIDWFLASVYDKTYEAMHAHCINLMLQGTLTFGQLVKLYTHQCFSRYPHFQVEDLSKNENYTNNSTKFQGKGKRKQHQTFSKNGHGNFKRYDTGKGKGKGRSKAGYNRDYNGPRRPSNEKGKFTQNSNHLKRKGKAKEKEKATVVKEKVGEKARTNKENEKSTKRMTQAS